MAFGNQTVPRSDMGMKVMKSDGYMAPKEDREENQEEEKGYKQVSSKYEEWMKGSWSSATMEDSATEDNSSGDNITAALEIKEEEVESEANNDPNWFEPRLNELTFPPNTINYNSVLNAWSRASRYNPYAAYKRSRDIVQSYGKVFC